jgi:hypothetical protein
VQGELHSCAGRKCLRKLEQQSPAAQISGPPPEGRTRFTPDLTRDDKGRRQPESSSVLLLLGEEQFTESLTLVGGKVRENHAVEDEMSCLGQLLMPDHPSVCFDGAVSRPNAKMESQLAPQMLGQFHTGSPLAEVPGPAYAGAGRSRTPRPGMLDRECNRVAGELLWHRPLVHCGPPSNRTINDGLGLDKGDFADTVGGDGTHG